MKTTKTLLLTAAAGLAAALSVQANTLFFDFGDHNQQTGALLNYNNVTITNLSIANAIDSTGAGTGIGLTASGFNPGSNLNGTTAPVAPANMFDPQATRDNLFGHTANFNQPAPLPLGVLTLTGLNPTATYDFTFFGSRTGVSDNRETKYDVLGTGFALLDTANNTANVAAVLGATSDAFGNLTVNVTKGPNNNNSSGFFYLGAMQIVAVPEPSSMALAVLGGFGLMIAGRRLRGSRF
jgi:hypothetical protein